MTANVCLHAYLLKTLPVNVNIYLTRNLSLRKMALSCNKLTNRTSGMNFDTMIYPSVTPQLSMKNVISETVERTFVIYDYY